MIEDRKAEAARQRAQAIRAAGLRGIGHGEERSRDESRAAAGNYDADGCDGLSQRFRRATGLGDDDETRPREVELVERGRVRRSVEIVVETHARTTLLRRFGRARNVPAVELRDRLAAEARAAGAEEHDEVGAVDQPCHRRLGLDEIRLGPGHGEVWQRPVRYRALQVGERPS
jgi:hypothetical protein